ncbi:MAG: hypothetical protein EA427_08915 [Spirochaetaceae bacterium]|nr:MAG: hypothetical protein EA427_08915 [Spirochaetaceae bacterium]
MERISENRIAAQDEEVKLLGIRTGMEPRGYVARQVTALARRGAVLFEEGHPSPWPIHRVTPFEGEFYLLGPWLEGETLEELLPSGGTGTGSVPVWLTAFLRATLQSLDDPDLHPGNIRTCLITRNNGVLLYNLDLARELNRSIPAKERARVHGPYADERLEGGAGRAFQAAAVLYHALCGTAPEARNEEGTSVVTPVHQRNPLVHQPIAEALDLILGGDSREEARLLSGIRKTLETNRGRWLDDVSPEAVEERREAARNRKSVQKQTRKRRSFWRRNRARLLAGALALIVVGSIPVTILRNHLKPPLTEGLGPMELIEGYYRAWTELDHLFMEDAVARGVSRDTIREVTNIYVIDRVQAAHAMHGRLIPPEDWMEAGRPGERVPYGVSDLEVTILLREENVVRAQARYYLWRPASDEEGLNAVLRVAAEDHLELHPTRYGWEIGEIRTRESGAERIPLTGPNPR